MIVAVDKCEKCLYWLGNYGYIVDFVGLLEV